MKVVHVTPFYSPSIGGVETIVKSTVEELARRGHEVFVVTTNLNNSLQKIAEEGIYYEGPVTVFRLRTFGVKIGYASFMRGLKNVLHEVKPSIVHCHNLHPHLFQAISWKNRIGYKVVVQLHNPVAVGIDHLIARVFLKPALYCFRHKVGYIDAVIAHTDLEFKWLKDIGVSEDKIFKLRFPGIPSKLIERYCHEKTRNNTVVYIGRINERKGLHNLLKAAAIIKNLNIKFVIAGPRDERYFRRLKTLRGKLNLENKVLFLNPLAEDEKYTLISSSLLFVHPALRDYTPVTLVEAQALGTPVIASKVGGIQELIKDGITGLLVKPNSDIDIAEAIKKIVENHELWVKMSIEAKKWITSNFLLEKIVDALETMYHKLLSK